MADPSLLVNFMNKLCLLRILLNDVHTFFEMLRPLLQALNLLILLSALTMQGSHLLLTESVLLSKDFSIKNGFHISIAINDLHQSVQVCLHLLIDQLLILHLFLVLLFLLRQAGSKLKLDILDINFFLSQHR